MRFGARRPVTPIVTAALTLGAAVVLSACSHAPTQSVDAACQLIAEHAQGLAPVLSDAAQAAGSLDDPAASTSLPQVTHDALKQVSNSFSSLQEQITNAEVSAAFSTFVGQLADYSAVFERFDPAAIAAADPQALDAFDQFNRDFSAAERGLVDAYRAVDTLCAAP